MTVRDGRTDDLKAAAIIAVVAIHAGWPDSEFLRFCMPVFIALWAFYFERSAARGGDVRALATRRFARLVVPYLFWTMLYLLLFHPFEDWLRTPPRTIIGGWFGGFGWSGQYFFIILFQLLAVMPLVRRCVQPATLVVIVAGGAILNVFADYWLFSNGTTAALNHRLFVYWLPYATLGVAFARGYPRRTTWLLLPAVLLLVLAPAESARLVAWQPKASPYLLATVTCASILLLLAAGPRFGESSSYAGIAWIRAVGRNTFPIFVGHVLVLHAVDMAGLLPGTMPEIPRKLLLIVVAVAGSMALGWALRRMRLGILVGG